MSIILFYYQSKGIEKYIIEATYDDDLVKHSEQLP